MDSYRRTLTINFEGYPVEHRYSARSATGLGILMYKQDKLVAVGVVKNCSKFGLFIETRYTDIRVLQTLTIEILAYHDANRLLKHRYEVRVMRKTEEGLGVEFEAVDTVAEKEFESLTSPLVYRQAAKILLVINPPMRAQFSASNASS